jgi:hypothetical protein
VALAWLEVVMPASAIVTFGIPLLSAIVTALILWAVYVAARASFVRALIVALV